MAWGQVDTLVAVITEFLVELSRKNDFANKSFKQKTKEHESEIGLSR